MVYSLFRNASTMRLFVIVSSMYYTIYVYTYFSYKYVYQIKSSAIICNYKCKNLWCALFIDRKRIIGVTITHFWCIPSLHFYKVIRKVIRGSFRLSKRYGLGCKTSFTLFEYLNFQLSHKLQWDYAYIFILVNTCARNLDGNCIFMM